MKIYSFKDGFLLIISSIFLFISSLILFIHFLFNNNYDLIAFISSLFCLSLILVLIYINRTCAIEFGDEIVSNVSFNGVNKFVVNPNEILSVNIINNEQLNKIYKKRNVGKKYILITLKYDKKVVIPCFWFSDKQINMIIFKIGSMVE